MGWEGKAAAAVLALGMSGYLVPGAAAQEPTPIIRPYTQTSEQQNAVDGEYQIVLDTMEQFVDISSDPFMENLYQNVRQSPEDFVSVVDPLGARDFYIPGMHTYFIYNEALTKDIPIDFTDWSILMSFGDLGDGIRTTTVSFQLNSSGHIYAGSKDRVSAPGVLPITTKALQADYLFNIPDEMQSSRWIEKPGDPFSAIRSHYDPGIGQLVQEVGVKSNAISLTINTIANIP